MIATWMAYSTLIAALTGVTAALLEPFARRTPLRVLWLVAMATTLAVTIGVAIRPVAPYPEGGGRITDLVPAAELQPTVNTPSLALDPLLTWSWVAASVVLALGLVAALAQLARLRRRARKAELEGLPIVVTGNLGPGAAPFGNPRVFMPQWATALERRVVHLLVAHEREHLRTADPRWLLIATFCCVLMPWNLAMWWMLGRLRCAMEIDCDRRVLSVDRDVQSYGELLLLVASNRSRPPLPALLTFAESASPLERRIRTMTENRPLTLARATTLGSAALAAILVACETPRPAPVAPTKTGSENAAPTVSAQKGDAGDQARGARLLEELRSAALPSQILQSSQQDPLLVVTSANGKVVSASRLGGVTEGTRVPIDALGVEPEAIESVDVIKKSGGLALPDEIRGGVIFVRLKAKGSVADAGDLSMMRTGQKTRIPVAERKPSEGEARQLMPENPLVEIYDASDRVVFSRRIASAARKAPAGSAMGDLPVDPKDIARVDVTKPAGVVRVYLKPGASLRNAK